VAVTVTEAVTVTVAVAGTVAVAVAVTAALKRADPEPYQHPTILGHSET
jgi:hypothetical protein